MRDRPSLRRAKELRTIARQLLQIAAEMEADMGDGEQCPPVFLHGETDEERDDGPLADFAESLYRHRRRRSRYLPVRIFAEPAWDILLDLYVNGVRNRQVSITSACIAGDIPATTGLRWLGVLEQEKLVEREVSKTDARVTLVRLTGNARQQLSEFFAESARTIVVPGCDARELPSF